MPEPTRPAGAPGGDRGFRVLDWVPYRKHTLRGFFSVVLPSGMVLRGCMLHEGDSGARWVSLAGQRRAGAEGTPPFASIVEFTSPAVREKFRRLALNALDAYLAGEQVAQAAGSGADE